MFPGCFWLNVPGVEVGRPQALAGKAHADRLAGRSRRRGLFRCDETNHTPNKTGALSKSSPPYWRAHYAHPRTYSHTGPTGSTTAGPTSGSRRPLFLRNAADTPPAVSNSRNKSNNRNTILEHLQRIAGGLNRRPVFHFGKQRISETPPGHFAKARISEINPARRCRHYPPKSALYTSRGPISCKKFAFFGVFNRPPGVIHKYLFVICCII